MKKPVVSLIRFYQKYLSPDHAIWTDGKQRVCRFYPTCSNYTVEAIEKYGVLKGSALGFWRILRCNPFNKGGHDPVR